MPLMFKLLLPFNRIDTFRSFADSITKFPLSVSNFGLEEIVSMNEEAHGDWLLNGRSFTHWSSNLAHTHDSQRNDKSTKTTIFAILQHFFSSHRTAQHTESMKLFSYIQPLCV